MPMDEAEWLVCENTEVMLRSLQGKASERKLRLLLVACIRRVPRLKTATECRQAVDLAERFADGEVSGIELETTRMAISRQEQTFEGWSAHRALLRLAESCVDSGITTARYGCLNLARANVKVSKREELRHQTGLIRDIFGNPFSTSQLLPPAVLAWNDRIIPRIAEGIYNERRMPEGTMDTGRLAILHDALLDAGCSDEAILTHLRSDGPHVRGCWAIDLILSKNR
jgi:hypothetical protein